MFTNYSKLYAPIIPWKKQDLSRHQFYEYEDLSFTHTHTHAHKLSLSHTHTHTHTLIHAVLPNV